MTGDQARALREELYDAGFRPVAISNPDADHPSAGKAPFGHDWTNRARLDPPEALRLLRMDALNTGVLCDGLRALDIDVDDVALVQRVRATAVMAWGEAPMRVRDNSPRCLLLYRAAEGEPPKRQLAGKHGKVEVLGRGQQFVAYGRHPSGAELRWMPEPPHLVPREQLPAVTEEQITQFFVTVAPMLEAAGEKASGSAAKAEDPAELRALLEAMAEQGAAGFTEPAHLPPDTAERLHEAFSRSGRARDRWNGLADDLIEGGKDHSRSGMDISLAALLKGAGAVLLDVALALLVFPHGAAQVREKHPTDAQRLRYAARTALRAGQARDEGSGEADAGREQRRIPGRTGGAVAAEPAPSQDPDLRVLRLHRRPPPRLPLAVFGAEWARWIGDAAEAAATSPDYVAAPLLASASATIGNARWAQAHPGWQEPPHLWMCSVGDSGGGKSPGADAILRDVLPRIEEAMCRDFPDTRREWEAAVAGAKARRSTWEKEVAHAAKLGAAPPLPPAESEEPPEPEPSCLRLNDTSIERVALMLAAASPKGLVMVRDELAGHLLGMNAYNDGGRAFWIESFGGRPYRVHRVKLNTPIAVPHLAVSWWGGTQPGRLAELMRGADDGLLARFCWIWPEAVPFDLPRTTPDVPWAVAAFDKLRLLAMQPTEGGSAPVMVPLAEGARSDLRDFGRDMQERQRWAGGLMNSALGKARGLALRLALNLEYLWWAGRPGMAPPPAVIKREAFAAAAMLVADYLLPMAERTYGDAAAAPRDRDAATLARWIAKERPDEIHVRTLQRDVRLPGLSTAEAIHDAAGALVEAGWLSAPAGSGGQAGRPKAAYPVNPALWGALTT